MTELLTAAQMRAIERAAIESGAVTGLELMERAGAGTVEAILAEWPELAGGARRAVVLCGPGNNGGDGFVVARLLGERGWAVAVCLYGEPDRLPPDARTNHERWRARGHVLSLEDAPDGISWPSGCSKGTDVDLVVDGVFGIGQDRPLPMAVRNVLHRLGMDFPSCPRLVALDVPSGLSSETGRVLCEYDPSTHVFPATLTVTYHAAKVGHYLADGPNFCGTLRVVSLDLEESTAAIWSALAALHERPHETFDVDDVVVRLAGSGWPATTAASKPQGHKYHHGHALVLSGGPGRGGAARMAARGALRIGAGLVTLGCPPGALQENAARLDAVMTRPLRGAGGLAAALEDERLGALALGPGLGSGEGTRALVATALEARRATVLDADALTAFADDPPALFARLHERCVLTPHGGEFARLFPDLAERLATPTDAGPAYSKVDATREAAARAGCVVLHKGPDTAIADPEGRAAIASAAYERSAPWLATAGAGDVLTGFIAGLLARGFPPMHAAEAAAWLHVECALEFGPGLIAEDLPDALPAVFRRLGL